MNARVYEQAITIIRVCNFLLLLTFLTTPTTLATTEIELLKASTPQKFIFKKSNPCSLIIDKIMPQNIM